MDSVKRVRNKLATIGEDYDSLKPNLQKKLCEIEEFFQNKEKSLEEALNLLKSCNVTVSAVQQALGGSRTVYYSHDKLLQRYVSLSNDELNAESPLSEIKRLRNVNADLHNKVALMSLRDVEAETKEVELSMLKSNLAETNKLNQDLQRRVIDLNATVKDLELKLNKR